MARELGMNPRKLGSLADGGQEPWKLPLPEFIVECYRKSFGRSEPEHVRSLEEVVQAEEMRRKKKQAHRADKMLVPAGSAQSAVPGDGVASASQRRVEFTPERLSIEFDRPSDNLVSVTFCMAISDFEQASRVMKIISGEIDLQ